MKKYIANRRSGVVLILALLLMAAITASAIGISVVISTTAHQSKNLDDFVVASLSADSGLERSLSIVKEGRKNVSLSTTVSAVGPYNGPVQTNNSSYSITAAASSEPFFVPQLARNQSFSFDILKPTAGAAASGLQIISSDPNLASGTLEVSWVLIDVNGNTNYSGRKFLSKSGYYPLGLIIDLTDVRSENSNDPLPFTGAPTLLGYRISIRALNNSVESITATPYTTVTGTPTTIPSRVTIISTGQAGSTRSIKAASVLWQLPSSKLFNYVLFTEGPIIPCSSIETTC